MNLKESFRYQNFIEAAIRAAGTSVCSADHCLTTTKKHLRSASNPDAEDITEVVEVDPFFSNDDVLRFMSFMVDQKKKLTEAICAAKKALPFDVDAAIATNKCRQQVCSSIRSMLRATQPSKRTTDGRDYKFNVEGNQTSYYYTIEVTKEVAYKQEEAKKLLKELIVKSDEVSSAIDGAMVTTAVDYEPPFDVNDTFEDVMNEFLKKTA